MRNVVLYSACVLAATAALAQSPGTGAIAGRISDESGAALARVSISATENATRVSRSANSSDLGEFRVALLSPGVYSISATASGFETAIVNSVSVVAGETATLEIRLKVGKANESVEVTAATDLAQTESSTLGRAIDHQAIESLPLANRNYTQLIALSPGVVVELPKRAALGRNSQNVSANGSKTTSNNIQFNGIDANNLSQNSASGYQSEVGTAMPAPDSIEEFKVQTATYDAGYGRGAGANVDLVSRAGKPEFHGSRGSILRNDALNANDFFAKRNGQARPVLKQNQYGVTAGRADSTRTSCSSLPAYQGSTQRNGGSNLSLVTAIFRNSQTIVLLGAGAQFCPGQSPGNAGYLTASEASDALRWVEHQSGGRGAAELQVLQRASTRFPARRRFFRISPARSRWESRRIRFPPSIAKTSSR